MRVTTKKKDSQSATGGKQMQLAQSCHNKVTHRFSRDQEIFCGCFDKRPSFNDSVERFERSSYAKEPSYSREQLVNVSILPQDPYMGGAEIKVVPKEFMGDDLSPRAARLQCA